MTMDRMHRLRELGRQRGRFQSKFEQRHAPKSKRPRVVHRGTVWESLFMRKSRAERRAVIQQPWRFPTAAQHLAAIVLQKRARGLLCRLRRRRAAHPSALTNSVPAARRCFQSPMQRFLAASRAHRFDDTQGFRAFTATRVQAWFRMARQVWRYRHQRFAVYHIAALELQFAWKAHCQRRLYAAHCALPPTTRAALVLQRAWRRYTQRRIFQYYRDLLAFRGVGDPTKMLRAINPSEAALLDAAMGASVRFRLGGWSFPPTIYYKIFTRKAVCDVNAFSPQDYASKATSQSSASRRHGAASMAQTRTELAYLRVGRSWHRARFAASDDPQRWYQRIERNGWRAVTAKALRDVQSDPITQATNSKAMPVVRVVPKAPPSRMEMERQRRAKKREWMRQLYLQHPSGAEEEMAPGREVLRGAELSRSRDDDGGGAGEMAMDMAMDVDWEQDADRMAEWVASLDFDAYVQDWQTLGKTAATDELALHEA